MPTVTQELRLPLHDFTQPALGSRDAKLDSLLRQPKDVRGLCLAQPFDGKKDERFLQRRRQRSQCTAQSGDLLAIGQRGLGTGRIVSDVERGLDRSSEGEEAADLTPSSPVVALVDRDAQDPRAERSRRIEAGERGKRGGESLLRQVQRFGFLTHMIAAHPEHGSAMHLQQLGIGRLFACARRDDERRIPREILRIGHLSTDQRVGPPVSALSTALSKTAAWEGDNTPRIATTWRKVSFCNSPITTCRRSIAPETFGP